MKPSHLSADAFNLIEELICLHVVKRVHPHSAFDFLGSFLITSLDRSGDKHTAEAFTMALESSGVPAFTPAP